MKVSELLNRLALGELSNLAIAEDPSHMLTEASHAKIILYTNEGLLRLYSRYMLRQNSLILEQVEHITFYHLKPKFAESSGSSEPFKYIKDLPNEPFTDDVIKVLDVIGEDGVERPLNDQGNPKSVFTPQINQLQVPSPVDGQALSLVYQARHPVLKDTGDTLKQQEIDLPFPLEGALQVYVAAKVYSHINGQENKQIAQEHLANFDSICVDLESNDLINFTHHTSHDKLINRGFV
jgi:hypothetical protein